MIPNVTNATKRAFYLIRHGESEHNLAIKETLLADGSVDLTTKFNPTYIDALMTKTGREQAEAAAKTMADKKVKYVICSPIRRCIETAKIAFKDHPYNPKILINPSFRELVCCVADMGSPLDEVQKMFEDVDFAPMRKYEKPHLWHVEDVFEEAIRKEIFEELKLKGSTLDDEKKHVHSVLIERMKKVYPKTLETYGDVYKRVQQCKQDLRELFSQLKEDETVAVVSHHGFLFCFTGTKFDEAYKPLDGLHLTNCEVCEFSID
jgi:broad specificity phosphatase PhoE